jgi:transcriptional regulator with GAF, ATPase, and Fis domain
LIEISSFTVPPDRKKYLQWCGTPDYHPAVVNPSISSPIFPDTLADKLVELAVTASTRLTRAQDLELAPAIIETLDEISAATGADGCQLVQFTAAGTVADSFSSAPIDGIDPSVLIEDWLTEPLARGESVVIESAKDLPVEAVWARELAQRTGACSILGVPAAPNNNVICALVLQSYRADHRWPHQSVTRLRLLADIFSAALHTRINESALRSNVVVIQELNARLQADNVYLKEEIKNYHDFDDIVGESAALKVALTRVNLVAPTNSTVLLTGTDRHRQGTVCPGAARTKPAARPVAGARQLRRPATDAGGERVVWPRKGRLHRRGRAAAGPV